jgi:hypothetical protein
MPEQPDSFMANLNHVNRDPASVPKLNPDFYKPRPQDIAFFRQQTGIHDDELLKQHILQVQAEAYKVHLPSLITDIHHAYFTHHFADS